MSLMKWRSASIISRGVCPLNFYQHGDYAFDDNGVGVGRELDLAVGVRMPVEAQYAAHGNAFDETVGSLEFF